MDRVLDVQSLGRRFGARQAVRGLSLSLDRGEILGLLGPNGAGKTSTLQMLSGLLAPSAGRVLVCGHDPLKSPRRAKAHIGYLPERAPLVSDLRVSEYLRYCGRLHGLRGSTLRAAVAAVLEECALQSVSRRLLGKLSKGYRQRVGLAQALLHDPALLLLDEPGDGLDPLQSHELRAVLRRRAERGSAVVLSSHRLDEVESLCTRVLMLRDGRELYRGELGARHETTALRLRLIPPTLADALLSLDVIEGADDLGDGCFRVRLAGGATPARLSRVLVERGFGLAELTPEPPDLKRLFLRGFGVEPDGGGER